jgi:hypothetical protein
MEAFEPTRAVALRVWWAFVWRAVLFSMGGTFLVCGGILLLGAPAGALRGPAQGVALALALALSVEAMFRALKKRVFPGFEIAIIRRK